MSDRKFLCEKCIDPFLEIVNRTGNECYRAKRELAISARRLRKVERDRDRWKRKSIRRNFIRPAWTEREERIADAQFYMGELIKDFRYYSIESRKSFLSYIVPKSRECPPIPLPEPKEIIR